MEWLLRKYMNEQHIKSFIELSKRTGINYQTLNNRMNNIGQLRIYELNALDEILHFSQEDLIKLIRGQA